MFPYLAAATPFPTAGISICCLLLCTPPSQQWRENNCSRALQPNANECQRHFDRSTALLPLFPFPLLFIFVPFRTPHRCPLHVPMQRRATIQHLATDDTSSKHPPDIYSAFSGARSLVIPSTQNSKTAILRCPPPSTSPLPPSKSFTTNQPKHPSSLFSPPPCSLVCRSRLAETRDELTVEAGSYK